ncbi:hypothetical protein [Mesorhizobium sp. CN2-181]|uniref:hypothetical protein n=1 Tax=Mesorhizobium yinganensis TaxID=3157707 RepID=UPI0032B79D8B
MPTFDIAAKRTRVPLNNNRIPPNDKAISRERNRFPPTDKAQTTKRNTFPAWSNVFPPNDNLIPDNDNPFPGFDNAFQAVFPDISPREIYAKPLILRANLWRKSRCGRQICEFSLYFPCYQGISAETGSIQTGGCTTQSSQKCTVSAVTE